MKKFSFDTIFRRIFPEVSAEDYDIIKVVAKNIAFIKEKELEEHSIVFLIQILFFLFKFEESKINALVDLLASLGFNVENINKTMFEIIQFDTQKGKDENYIILVITLIFMLLTIHTGINVSEAEMRKDIIFYELEKQNSNFNFNLN